MASKQLGKLRQWAGEVISSRDKTDLTDDLKELEKDVEIRKAGITRLTIASEAYYHAISKKKDCDALGEVEKMLPIETLGIVMITHGEQFPSESNLGSSLVKLGRAHCKVASLQETFAGKFRDSFLISLDKFRDDIKEFEQRRKKLDSRRLAFDAATSKADKAKSSKKEKEKSDAEEELEKARARFEESEEEVQEQAHSIQENEIDQLRELTSFLDLEVQFVEKYLDVLKETQSEWANVAHVSPNRSRGPVHVFPSMTKERNHASKTGSTRSKRSNSSRSRPKDESSDSETESVMTAHSRSHRRNDSGASTKAPSRPASRSSRKRADSTATEKDEQEKEKEPKKDRPTNRLSMPGWGSFSNGAEKDEEKEKAKDKSTNRLSVAGWASSAVGSVTSIGKKGKDRLVALYDDEKKEKVPDEAETTPVKKSSPVEKPTILRRKSSASKAAAKLLKPRSMQEKKVVRALYDFSGSSDELSFKAGDEIAVVSEVLEGWWMGELGGKKGLFPTAYAEVVSSNPPALPVRPGRGDVSEDDRGWRSSDAEEDEMWRAKPMSPLNSGSPFYSGVDNASITSAEDEDDHLMPSFTRNGEEIQPRKVLETISPYQSNVRTNSAPGNTPKKAPPPPPPRRSTGSFSAASTPPIPSRRPAASRKNSHSSSGSGSTTLLRSNSSSVTSHEYETSPFDSAVDLDASNENDATGCGEFRQNPFKPKGLCSNCFAYHAT